VRKGRYRAALGITALSLVALFALLMGTDPVWFQNLRESIRTRMEGWSVVKMGDFKPVSLRTLGDTDEIRGEDLGPIQGFSYQTGAILYFSCAKPITPMEFYQVKRGAEPDSYAMLVTPKGSDLQVPISRCSEPNVYAVQIPAVHSPDTQHLMLHIRAKGLAETTVRVHKPPHTVDRVPQSGPVVQEIRDGDVTVSGRAFTTVAKGSTKPIGVGYRLDFSKPENLDWRLGLYDSSLEPFTKLNIRRVPHPTATMAIRKRDTIGAAQGVCYPSEISKIAVKARLDGYETQVEVVDFGTFPLLKEIRDPSSPSPHYFLDFSKPMTKQLPSGLKVTLLPLRSAEDVRSYIGSSSLYFRLLVEPDSLRDWMKKNDLKDGEVMIEANLIGDHESFHGIYPEPQGNNPSNVVMLFWKPTDAKKLSVKLQIRHCQLRRRIPIDLRLSVDQTNPRQTRASRGAMTYGAEFFN
jgi:hypothetical protein